MIQTRTFDVVLMTEIGPRYGTMEVVIDDGQVAGSLKLFGESHAFSGKYAVDGQCRLEGIMKTLMRSIHYVATGYMDGERVALTLRGNEEWDTTYVLKSLAIRQPDQV